MAITIIGFQTTNNRPEVRRPPLSLGAATSERANEACTQQSCGLGSVNRAAEEIALRGFAASRRQEPRLLRIFDAFRKHSGVQFLGKTNGGANHRSASDFRRAFENQLLCNLDSIDRKVGKIVERRIAGAEIIDCKSQPERSQTRDDVAMVFGGLH